MQTNAAFPVSITDPQKKQKKREFPPLHYKSPSSAKLKNPDWVTIT